MSSCHHRRLSYDDIFHQLHFRKLLTRQSLQPFIRQIGRIQYKQLAQSFGLFRQSFDESVVDPFDNGDVERLEGFGVGVDDGEQSEWQRLVENGFGRSGRVETS